MFVLYDDVQKINKQPGIQKIWNLCGHYQDIYSWHHWINRQTYDLF